MGAKAAAAGVSRSTAAKVEQVKKQKPEAVADIAAGKSSANKVLNKTKNGNSPDQPDVTGAPKPPTDTDEGKETKEDSPKKQPPFKPGDKMYLVDVPLEWLGAIEIKEYTIKSVTDNNYVPTCGGHIDRGRKSFGDLDKAKKEWTARIEDQMGVLQKALKKGPRIVRR